MYCQKNVGQQNGMESPEIDLYQYNQLIFYKGTKTTQWGQNKLKVNGVEKTGYTNPPKY